MPAQSRPWPLGPVRRRERGLRSARPPAPGEDGADRFRAARPLPAAPALRRGGAAGARPVDPREGRAAAASRAAPSGGGERRWRAAQMAQLHEIPVVIREFEDREALEIALVENIQRQDLSPLEEAEGYRRLMEEFGHTQERLAEAVGKSRSHVANMMRLLGLPDTVKELLAAGTLSAGHARALLNAADPAALAAEVVRRGLNVRATEKLAQAARGQGSAPAPKPPKDADTAALERDLANLLGLRVTVNFAGRGGSLTIHYRTLEQLDDVLRRLHKIPPSR